MSNHLIPEKSLCEIWSRSLVDLPQNAFNRYVMLSGLSLGLLPLVVGKIDNFRAMTLPLAELSAQIVAGLLGFIIAAYAIFASSSSEAFLVGMSDFTPRSSKVPLLKIHLLNFVRLFIYSFSALIGLMLLILLGRVWPSLKGMIILHDRVIIAAQVMALAVLGISWTTVAIQMKSVIFNIYDLTLTQVRYVKATREATETDKVAPLSPNSKNSKDQQ